MRISAEPTLPSRPPESAHGLGGMAEIIHYIQAKPGLTRQILQEREGVVVGILMGEGSKRPPTCCADGA